MSSLKIVSKPALMELSSTGRYNEDEDEDVNDKDLFLNVFKHFMNDHDRRNKIKNLIKFNDEMKDDINMTDYYTNYKKVYEELKNSIKIVEKYYLEKDEQTDEETYEEKEKYKDIFFQYLYDCNEIYINLDSKDKQHFVKFKKELNEYILYLMDMYYNYLVKEHVSDDNHNKKNDNDMFFKVFKIFSGFENDKNRKHNIGVITNLNTIMKKDEYYYNIYQYVYIKLKNRIKREQEKVFINKNKRNQEQLKEQLKEKYKELFDDYITNCKNISKKLTNTNITDRTFKQILNTHIIHVGDMYETFLNKDADDSVRGGKKSSEYIDYKFQNKIYRRKIRYEGKKKYIILNKQKVFIKNKK